MKQRVAAEPVIERLLQYMVEFQTREGYGKTIPHAGLERILGMSRAKPDGSMNTNYYNRVKAARERLEEEHHIHVKRRYNEGYTLLAPDDAMSHGTNTGNTKVARAIGKTVRTLRNIPRDTLSEGARSAHEFLTTRWRLRQANHSQERALEKRVANLLEPPPVKDGQPLLKATAS